MQAWVQAPELACSLPWHRSSDTAVGTHRARSAKIALGIVPCTPTVRFTAWVM